MYMTTAISQERDNVIRTTVSRTRFFMEGQLTFQLMSCRACHRTYRAPMKSAKTIERKIRSSFSRNSMPGACRRDRKSRVMLAFVVCTCVVQHWLCQCLLGTVWKYLHWQSQCHPGIKIGRALGKGSAPRISESANRINTSRPITG